MKHCCKKFKQAVRDEEILKTGNKFYKPNVSVDDFWNDTLNVILSDCPFCNKVLSIP